MCAGGGGGGRGGLGRGGGGGGAGIGLDVAVRCGGGLQRGQHPGGHGGAGEAPQDQHHHQQKGEAATHPSMIRRTKGWFPGARAFLPRGRWPACANNGGRPGRWALTCNKTCPLRGAAHGLWPVRRACAPAFFPCLAQKGMWSTLPARIRWLVLWATLPAVLLVVYQARAHRTDAIAAAEARALQTLHSVAGTQQRLIQNTRQFLQQLAAMPQVRDPAAPECGRYLAEVLSLNTTYVNIGVPRADGDLLCNARPLKAPVNVANRPYFQQTITGRDFAVGSFQVDRAAQVAS
eukprot:gene51182-68511_t